MKPSGRRIASNRVTAGELDHALIVAKTAAAAARGSAGGVPRRVSRRDRLKV